MITKLLFDFFAAVVDFIVSLIPTSAPPGWVSDGAGMVSTVLAYGGSLGAWIPWASFGTVLAAVFVSFGVGVAIKLVRIVASFFTAGGGSAA